MSDTVFQSGGLVGKASIPQVINGAGIRSIEQTTHSTEDDGINTITITSTDGEKTLFNVKNGSKGSQGKPGNDGHTPIKGVDYFTDSEKQEIVDEVAALVPSGGVTSWNDLEDRPFYEGIVREQLYSYIGDVTTQYDDTYYVADLSTPLNGLYSGLNITVVINHDGIENTYTNVPIEEQYVGGGTYLFDYLGGKDGYPFKITSNKLYVTASGHYTVYVYKNSQTIKQIPSKFIPIDRNGVYSGSTEHFATNYQIKSYVANEISNALNAIGVAEEGAY